MVNQAYSPARRLRPHPAVAAVPGLAITAVGVAVALLLHSQIPAVGVLTWAVLLGAVTGNVWVLPSSSRLGLRIASRRLLRIGVMLMGFSLSLGSVASLGLPVIFSITGTLLVTLAVTYWVGCRLRVGRPRSLLIATGFAICGASAVAAMQDSAEADDDDVAAAVAMVTIYGSLAMVAVPLLQGPLGLSREQWGVWAGASIHEVAQVVAAAGPAGAAALGTAVVVKLTRVVLLAPVVAAVSSRRRCTPSSSGGERKRGPVVPVFVLGFLACAGLQSLAPVPANALRVIETTQTLALAAALFALGTGVQLTGLLRTGGRALSLGAISTLVVTGVSLGWVLLLV